MNRLIKLILLLFFLCSIAVGQTVSHTAFRFRQGSSLPSTCAVGDVFYRNSNNTFYGCTSLNTFTAFSAGGGGTGDFVGPSSSTDNAILRFDGTTGKLGQNSLVTIDDSGSVNIPTGQTYKINNTSLAKGDIGLGNVDNTSDATKNSASVTLTNKILTSPVINSPTGIVKGDVGLGNVDNTSDTNKPISTAQQTALDLKANLISPVFTGTPSLPSGTISLGSFLVTAIAAPGTPAAGKGSIYIDSTSKNLSIKDDAGIIKHGVQTKTAVSNSFATAISDDGIVTVVQPSFSNISGSVAASQLPNPSSSTLGGIQSLTPVTSKWINTISTSGVPSATQPAFTDVSGSVAASQMPALTGDITTVAGNVATTLATVASAGTTGSSTAIPVVTINVKGLTTSITTAAVVAPAGTLSGATLASGVLASSLTSVGTLAGLTVTGTAALPIVTQTGKTTNYNGIATVSNGIPSELATIDTTNLSAAVTTATLYTPTATGMYRISAVIKITTTGTSPVAGPLTITYTDGDGSVAQSQIMLLHSTTGTVVTTTVNNSTTTGTVYGSMVIYALASVAIQYAVAVSGTFGSGRYSVHLKCEAM